MKQILQNLGSGETLLAEIPVPRVRSGCLLIRTQSSLVSLGTERMLVEFGKANLLDKARQQPEKVKQVIQKIKTDGLSTTVQAVRSKLDQPLPLGYSNAGVVVNVGAGVQGFQVGDRVLSNGPHAEFVCVPQNLCAKIPDTVSFDSACFGVVASIGLQGIRLIQPTMGERFVVTGLGLIGLLCVQLLRANGCKVLGIDFDSSKCEVARKYGAETVDLSQGQDPLVAAQKFTQGKGVDGVLITASTKSNEPVHQAAEMCRKRGRIVLVGVVGLELQRGDFYEKELSFQISCSYGPGRYDPAYEEKGADYPFGLVRWTEQRNFEAVLGLMESGDLDCAGLITHRYSFDDALQGYEQLSAGSSLGVVLKYPESQETPGDKPQRTVRLKDSSRPASSEVVVGLLGAGNFTGQVLLPALAQTEARLKTIVSGSGVTGTHHGKKHGFERSSTAAEEVFADDEVNLVMITTPHGSHGAQVLRALEAGKHVFVEKPLCLKREELEAIEKVLGRWDIGDGISGEEPKAVSLNRNPAPNLNRPTIPDDGAAVSTGPTKANHAAAPILMVGFNRRFSPHAVKMKQLLGSIDSPKSIVFTVNAGEIPADHWTQDPEVGGGRIIGEACHFIDFCRFLTGRRVTESSIDYLGGQSGSLGDIASIHLKYEDGSIATVHYFANGSKAFPKERVEVFCAGRILQLDNFRKLVGFGWPGFKRFKTRNQSKGHREEMTALVDALKSGGAAPIPLEETLEASRIAIELSGEF